MRATLVFIAILYAPLIGVPRSKVLMSVCISVIALAYGVVYDYLTYEKEHGQATNPQPE